MLYLKYILGAIISIPLLPILFYQGKKIRKSVPTLPEAKNPKGKINFNGESKATFKLITIGESTIAGIGVDTHAEGFTGSLAKGLSQGLQLNIDWKVYAKSGYTAKMVYNRIVPKIDDEHQDLIVIGLGGNDSFTLNRPWTWKKDCITLIDKLRSKYPKAPIVFCNMPPIKEFPAFTSLAKFVIGNLVEIHGKTLVHTVSKIENVYYLSERITLKGWIDKFNLKNKKEDFFSDGVHPSKLTYQTWGHDVALQIYQHKLIDYT